REAWTARAAGSFSSADERLVEVTKTYVGELGAEVEPYVAPAMNVLRPVLDTLPQPLLSDADQDEKVGLVD
ncbi:MAG: MXAN_6521/LA_1396 family lipoprotein, partial [Myxococcaceae bacterium]|nr:MXAN_6521/LA_1396 family lipoprotein [Myxococcaceae bacterium]